MFRSWRQSVRELGERVERLEGELGRLNMENADLKSQLKERDARIAKLESVLEESRRAGKRQAAPFSKDKPKRDPKKPGRKPGSKYGRQAVRAIPVPDKTFEAPCPEQCPCGGKVGAEGSIDLYQVDIPPIQPALLHGPEQIADLPVPVAESPGAVRIGHPERSHLVEYLAPNSVFNSLPRQRSSPHLRPDDRLVTIDRVLHHASLGVA